MTTAALLTRGVGTGATMLAKLPAVRGRKGRASRGGNKARMRLPRAHKMETQGGTAATHRLREVPAVLLIPRRLTGARREMTTRTL